MSTVYTLKDTIASKDLADLLDRCLELWTHIAVRADTGVHLFVQTSHSAAIQTIAETLPPEHRGFSPLGAENNFTAAEVLEKIAALSGDTWHGSFAADVAPERLVPLLQRLRGLRADPLRRTSVSVTARSIQWNSAHPEFIGDFQFIDAKVFRRKVRFSFAAFCTLPATAPTRQVREAFECIRAATGIDFRRGDKTTTTVGGEWTARQRANACIAFDEVVERVSQSLVADGFDWRSLRGVFPDNQGVRRRFHTLGTGGSFRWEKHLTAFVTEVFPAFRKKGGLIADAQVFVAPLEGPWFCMLVFDTHPGRRIGRVFKVRCGVTYTEAKTVRFKRTAPVLRCSGGAYYQHHDECPEFSFDTEAELMDLFQALGPFLRDYLTRFKAGLQSILLPGCEKVSAVLSDQRELTAHQANELAKNYLSAARIEFAALISVSLAGAADSLEYRTDRAAEFSTEGKSSLYHYWEMRYAVPTEFATIEVSVPYLGSIRHARHENPFMELNPHLIPTALPAGWCDSDAAARSMRAKRDELSSRYPEMKAVVGLLRLTTEADRPVWTAHIEFSGHDGAERGWVLVTHAIDAISTKPVSTKFDERFPDRAIPNNVFTESYD